ncbi:MAG: hypothetical protein JJ979_09170 [Roseibium sp.]|nr:hypothetical protein [Roseibium sp.]
MEKIELRNSRTHLSHGHLFVIYTNRKGEEFIVRAGPGILLELGKIDVEIGPYTPVSRDWVPMDERSAENNRLLLRGDDLEETYLKMAFAAQLIEQSKVDYDTLAAVSDDDSAEIVNSNTLVAATLDAAGIEPSQDMLPPSADKWPPAGFQNKAALNRPVAAFLARSFNADAGHGEPAFREVYEGLEAIFVAENQGQIEKLRNFTNGKGDDYPEFILKGIDWQATEQRIRELHQGDPSLAAGIISDLALAKTLRGDWEEEFRAKFNDLLVFENGLRNGTDGQPDAYDGVSGPLVPLSTEPLPGAIDNARLGGATPDQGQLISQTPAPDLRLELTGPSHRAAGSMAGKAPRKTSYDRVRQLGRTPDEKAQAIEEYRKLLEESHAVLGGDPEAAHKLAAQQFYLYWDLSAFAPDGEGIVMKNPVERVYPDLEDGGHDYVRRDAEAFLAEQGIAAKNWYLSPSERTESDWRQGWTDTDGYGPRMTLLYDDEDGIRHHVTDNFQANVRRASREQHAKKEQETRALDRN